MDREVIHVDNNDETVNDSWVDIIEQKNYISEIKSAPQKPKKLKEKHINNKDDFRHSAKRSRKNSFSSNYSSYERNKKKCKYLSRNRDKYQGTETLDDQSTTSSKNVLNYVPYSMTNETYVDKYERRHSTATTSNDIYNKKYLIADSKSNSNSKRSTSRKKLKHRKYSKGDLYDEYCRNKMYMNYLRTNIAAQAIQALLEISTSMSNKILE